VSSSADAPFGRTIRPGRVRALTAPQVVANLTTGGWTYSASREGVADTYGVVVD